MSLLTDEVKTAVSSILGKVQAERLCDLITRKNSCAIDWHKVEPLGPSQLVKYADLPEAPEDKLKEFLGKVAMLKLNGGLGTSMGLSGPKSTIVVKDNKNFLQLIFEQIRHLNSTYGVNVPLVLMNSFNTEADTMEWVNQYKDVDIRCFNQNQFPRLYSENLLPMADSPDSPSYCWYPPGHGDVYDCLLISGVLEKLLSEGKEYIFISNSDNLGATMDTKILTRLFTSPVKKEILMELTPKLPQDIKGGTVINYPIAGGDGQKGYKLLEIAQVASQFQGEFKSARKFSVFNTNNMWINLAFLKKSLEDKKLQLDVISNPKKVGQDSVLQLETACGSVVSCSTSAENADVLSVPRTRFIPTKMCSDLMLIQSDYYVARNGSLIVNPQRNFATQPLLSMGPFFTKINDLKGHCPSIPKLIDLESLTVCGDVSFGTEVTLRGNVVIVAKRGERLYIPSHAVLEDVTVMGALEITTRI